MFEHELVLDVLVDERRRKIEEDLRHATEDGATRPRRHPFRSMLGRKLVSLGLAMIG